VEAWMKRGEVRRAEQEAAAEQGNATLAPAAATVSVPSKSQS